MRVPLVFGKRDQKKYSEVIEWLESIESGWRNDEVKEALLEFVNNKKLHNNAIEKEQIKPSSISSNINNTDSTIIYSKPMDTPIKDEVMPDLKIKNINDQDVLSINHLKEVEVEVEVEDNTSSGFDKFLGI